MVVPLTHLATAGMLVRGGQSTSSANTVPSNRTGRGGSAWNWKQVKRDLKVMRRRVKYEHLREEATYVGEWRCFKAAL